MSVKLTPQRFHWLLRRSFSQPTAPARSRRATHTGTAEHLLLRRAIKSTLRCNRPSSRLLTYGWSANQAFRAGGNLPLAECRFDQVTRVRHIVGKTQWQWETGSMFIQKLRGQDNTWPAAFISADSHMRIEG